MESLSARRYLFLLPALVWAVIIALLSLWNARDLPELSLVGFDKVAHAGAYGLLACVTIWGAHRAQITLKALLVILFVALYGLLMEYLQHSFSPSRYLDKYDALANLVGAILALPLVPLLKKT